MAKSKLSETMRKRAIPDCVRPVATHQSLGMHFLSLRGIAKQVFRDLGGGETFLRLEGEQFYDCGADPGDEWYP